MLDIEKHKRKPVYVDAVVVTENNLDEVAAWCGGEIKKEDYEYGIKYIVVPVTNPMHDRQTKAYPGDRVLSSTSGFKVYTEQAFRKSFERLEGVERDKATQASKPPHVQEMTGLEIEELRQQ